MAIKVVTLPPGWDIEEVEYSSPAEALIVHVKAGDAEPASVIHKARAITGLNIRQGPGINYADIGDLPKDTTVEVLEEQRPGNDVWVRIGYRQWCAMLYQGKTYMEYTA
jgi:uncharacterized protein YraI